MILLCLIDVMFYSLFFNCHLPLDLRVLHLSFRLSLQIYGREKLLTVKSQATPIEERMGGQLMIFLVIHLTCILFVPVK
jgi:hypothetical protein